MSAIKSTLDLILEKTRHLSLSEDEKNLTRRRELTRRVRGIALRFLDGETDPRSLVRQTSELTAEDREQARELFREVLLEYLSPFEDNQRVLAGVEALIGSDERLKWETQIEHAAAPCLRREQEILEEAETHARAELAGKGLRGPALRPLVRARPFWKEERDRITAAFRESLRQELASPAQR